MATSTSLSTPPLGTWGHLWREAVAGVGGLITFGLVWHSAARAHPGLALVDLLVGLLSLVLLPFHRRFPVTVAWLVVGAGLVSLTSLLAQVIVTVSIGTRRRWTEIAGLGVWGLATGLFYNQLVRSDSSWWGNLLWNAAVSAGLFTFGLYVGSRRELLATLHERAERAEAEQELRVTQARQAERARIAREMHDVLAHRLSLVCMHAGALSYRIDLSRDEIADSADIINTNAKLALTELRQTIGLLREHVEGASTPPQPSLCDVPRLVDEAIAAGMRVEWSNALNGDRPPDSVGRAAYRIVQEGLTNARKHAPGTRVFVSVGGHCGDDLQIDVRNPPDVARTASIPGSGSGLLGLVERANLVGGRLEHGADNEGWFVLRAMLPWRE